MTTHFDPLHRKRSDILIAVMSIVAENTDTATPVADIVAQLSTLDEKTAKDYVTALCYLGALRKAFRRRRFDPPAVWMTTLGRLWFDQELHEAPELYPTEDPDELAELDLDPEGITT